MLLGIRYKRQQQPQKNSHADNFRVQSKIYLRVREGTPREGKTDEMVAVPSLGAMRENKISHPESRKEKKKGRRNSLVLGNNVWHFA